MRDHCSKGHPFSGHNLMLNKKNERACRTCMNERARRKYAAATPEERRALRGEVASFACPVCQGPGQCTPWRLRKTIERFGRPPACSTNCAGQLRSGERLSLRERFDRHVASRPSDGCWVWEGSVDRRNYGQMRHDGRLRMATHMALLAYKNVDVPNGMMACHRCDNPICVNPDHLFVGTALDNQRDSMAKGRHSAPPISKPKANCAAGHSLMLPGSRYIVKGRAGGCVICARARVRQWKANRRAGAHV